MDFTEYTKTIFTNTTSEEIKLSEAERATIASYLVENSLIGMLGTKLTIQSANRSNVVFLKNLGQTWSDKEKPGPGEFETPKLQPVTINWLKPKKQAVAYTEADLQLGLPDSTRIKLEAAAKEFNKEYERYCWKEIETKVSGQTDSKIIKDILDDSVEPKKAFAEIMNLADKLLTHKSKKEYLDGISKEDIIIFVKPSVFTKLVLAGLTGSMAQTAFIGGKYAIANLGGYTIVENQYLDIADVIVTTNFIAASMKNVNAANVGVLNPTNDIGLYFEAMALFGFVYESPIYGYFKA